MARQLLERGHKVAFLGLLDTYPPGPNRQADFLDRVKIHRDNLRGLSLRQVFGYFKDRWTALLIRLTHIAPVYSFIKRINYIPKNAYEAALISSHGYEPAPYPGDVFLFKAVERPWYVHWDPLENWQKHVLGKIEIREVQGKHGSMLFEPNVQELSRQLNDCLRQVEAGQAGSG
jgi:thioesterase domain-containing protein